MKVRIGQPIKSVLTRQDCLLVGQAYSRAECGYVYALGALRRPSPDAEMVRTGLKTAERLLGVIAKEHGPMPSGTKGLAKRTTTLLTKLQNKEVVPAESVEGIKKEIDALLTASQKIWNNVVTRCG